MEKLILNATRRDIKGKKVGQLRREGKLPAVIYGHHMEPQAILLDLKETSRGLRSLSRSSLVTINLDGVEHASLVREKQRDFIRGTLLHVDFQAVSLTEKIRTKVGIELVGISPAVKDFNGIVVANITEMEVECLPQDLPEKVVVDISKLKQIGDHILLKDIVLSTKVEVFGDPEEAVVLITTSKEKEEEVTEEAGEIGVSSEPEVIERGKKEEDKED